MEKTIRKTETITISEEEIKELITKEIFNKYAIHLDHHQINFMFALLIIDVLIAFLEMSYQHIIQKKKRSNMIFSLFIIYGKNDDLVCWTELERKYQKFEPEQFLLANLKCYDILVSF